jgi:hypothetical protein
MSIYTHSGGHMMTFDQAKEETVCLACDDGEIILDGDKNARLAINAGVGILSDVLKRHPEKNIEEEINFLYENAEDVYSLILSGALKGEPLAKKIAKSFADAILRGDMSKLATEYLGGTFRADERFLEPYGDRN